MKSIAILAAAGTLAAACFVTAPAARAQSLVLPSATETVKTVSVDVDGDGKKDKVKVATWWSNDGAHTRVRVSSTKTRRVVQWSSVDQSSRSLIAAARFDGVKGYEVILDSGSEYDGYTVLTWRKGRLAKAGAPMLRDENGSRVSWWSGENYTGFRISMAHGKRYVYSTCLWMLDDGRWTGKTFRSVWRSGAWRYQKVSALGILSEAEALRYSGFHGIKLVRP